MVAGSYHSVYVIAWRPSYFWRQQCSCAIYLFSLLKMKWQQKHTSLTVIAIGFGILYFFFRKEWMLVPIGIVFIGFLFGNIGSFIHLAWMMIAKILGFINSRILLSLLFFFILTPVALIMRLLGKGTFIKSIKNKSSLFETRNHLYTKTDLINPF